jgi:hypothetical protein
VPPELAEEVLQILLSSLGGFNTVKVGATPLSSVDVIVRIFVLPLEIVCVVFGRPIIVGASLSAEVT